MSSLSPSAELDKIFFLTQTGNSEILDQWLLSRLHSLIDNTQKEMSAYRLYNVVPRLLQFIEELTNTYIRFYLEMSRENAGAETLFLLGRDGNIITTNGELVPEPSTGLLLSGALLGLGAWARRRRK